MISMFRGCSSLKEINFFNFNTDLVSDMSYLFHTCSSLKIMPPKLNLNILMKRGAKFRRK